MVQERMRVELKLNVVLVGLHEDGAYGYSVDASSLASLLTAALPTYRPALVEEERPLHIEYALRYDVHHQRNIATYTNILAEELKKIHSVRSHDSALWLMARSKI